MADNMDFKYLFYCEYTKSNRGICKACHSAISKNVVKVGFAPDDHWGIT